MPTIITIPKPCHENWDNFTPAEQGKHCQVCAKTVIDFTEWQPNAIANYLSDKAEGETCGRFTKTQLDVPIPSAEEFAKQISYFRISTLKKIAAIFLFAFMLGNSSCTNENEQGKALIENTKIVGELNIDKGNSINKIDTTQYLNENVTVPQIQAPIVHTMGDIVPIIKGDIEIKTTEPIKCTLLGEPAIQQIPDAPISDSSKINDRKIMGKPAFVQPQILMDSLKCNTYSLQKFSNI